MVLPRYFEVHTAERLFAVDLITHVFGRNNTMFVCNSLMTRAGPYPGTPFLRRIREAVDFLSLELRDHMLHALQSFLSTDVSPGLDGAGTCFEAFIRRLSFNLDGNQFHMMEFLEFVTIVANMALHLVKMGVIMAGNHAVEGIADTVQWIKRTGRFVDWQALEEFAGGVPEKWHRRDPVATSTEADPAASPEADPAASPEADPAASPEADPAASPEADPAASPEADPAASPEADPAASSEFDPAASPEGDPAISSEFDPVSTSAEA